MDNTNEQNPTTTIPQTPQGVQGEGSPASPVQMPTTAPSQFASQTPPPASPTPPAPPQTPSAPTSGGGSKTKIVIFGIIVLLVITGVLVYVFALKPKSPTAYQPPQPVSVSPTATPTPTQTIDQALNTVDATDPTADLQDINSDLQQL